MKKTKQLEILIKICCNGGLTISLILIFIGIVRYYINIIFVGVSFFVFFIVLLLIFKYLESLG